MKKTIIAIVIIIITVVIVSYFKKPILTEEKLIEIYGDFGVKDMESYLNSLDLPEDAVVRGRLAMKQWKNDKIDPKPILVIAEIIKRKDRPIRIDMYFSDEDKNVIGFGIREEHFFANDKPQIIEEVYPVFIHLSPPTVWACCFEIELRTEGKRKDENLWQAYVNKDVPIEEKPPIVASVPDPNSVDVWVWVYDRAGNKSDAVKAVTAIKSRDSKSVENSGSNLINRKRVK